jgi:hypothetical protein
MLVTAVLSSIPVRRHALAGRADKTVAGLLDKLL